MDVENLLPGPKNQNPLHNSPKHCRNLGWRPTPPPRVAQFFTGHCGRNVLRMEGATHRVCCDRFKDERDPPPLARRVNVLRVASQEKDQLGDGRKLVCASLELGKGGVDPRMGGRDCA